MPRTYIVFTEGVIWLSGSGVWLSFVVGVKFPRILALKLALYTGVEERLFTASV